MNHHQNAQYKIFSLYVNLADRERKSPDWFPEWSQDFAIPGADLGGGCRGRTPSPTN